MATLEEFLRNYEKKFYKNLESLSEKLLKDKEALTGLREIFYGQFLKKTPVKDFFYNLGREYAEREENVKTVILKVCAQLIKDFVDYLMEKEDLSGRDIKELKELLAKVEEISEAIDRAYGEYYRSLEKNVSFLKKKLEEEELEHIYKDFELAKLKGEELIFTASYKQIPIQGKGVVEEVSSTHVKVRFSEKCLVPVAVEEGGVMYAKGESLSKIVKLKILKREENYLTLSYERYEENILEKRRYVRVIPAEDIPVFVSGTGEVGVVADLSVGGVGIYFQGTSLKTGQKVRLRFTLKGREIEVLSVCRHVTPNMRGLKAGFEFKGLSTQEEEFLSRYVMERQLELLKELREKF